MANIDSEPISEAYHDVRNDATETTWAAFGYEDKRIVFISSGEDYSDFLDLCTDDARIYGFIRVMTGDEMSRRAKFAFITFIGTGVSPLKKARVSTDKAFVKQICQNFAKEILAESRSELDMGGITAVVVKAGGANYGSGK